MNGAWEGGRDGQGVGGCLGGRNGMAGTLNGLTGVD